MPKLTLSPRMRAFLLTAAGLSVLAGGVVAQVAPMEPIQWDKRRLDQLDRNVRRLERAVTQRNAAGQPVLVEPDPEVVALQGRVASMDQRLGDLEATLQRVNGELERSTFALDEADEDNGALRDRLNDAETRLRVLETAAERARADAQAAAEAAAQEGASPTGNAGGDLAAARALLASDPEAGAQALEDLVANWPDTPQGREANWRLGDARRAGGDTAGAVQAYASALSGWPTAPWAGETTLKLARGLAATNRRPQACAALGEFDRRYAAAASADLKAVAARVRTEARCA